MPIYEYHCDGCNSDFEITQKFSDAPLTSCPRCSGKVHKLISQSSFVLKGSGWYATDYAGKNSKSTSEPSKSEGAPACGASGSKPACSGCPSSGD